MKQKLISFFILFISIESVAQDTLNIKQDSLDFKFRYYGYLGGFFPFVNSSIQIDPGDGGLGAILSFEDLLNLNENPSVIKAGVRARATRRSFFNFNYFKIRREGLVELDRDIQVGDTVIHAGASLSTKLESSYFGLTCGYALIVKPDWHTSISFGIRAVEFKTDFNYSLLSSSGSYSSSTLIPVALIGINIGGYMLPRLYGHYSFETFRLSINGIGIQVYESRLGLEYYVLKNLGAGFGYSNIMYSVKEIPFNDTFDGKISYNLTGISFYLTSRF
jgi:hypothetical protein